MDQADRASDLQLRQTAEAIFKTTGKRPRDIRIPDPWSPAAPADYQNYGLRPSGAQPEERQDRQGGASDQLG